MKIKYVSTPIYYPNSVPHIGHIYSNLIADVWKRAAVLMGKKAFLSTGLDEHGQKVAQAAQRCGYSPKEHVDYLSGLFISFFRKYNLDWDVWVRTTNDAHKASAQAFWKKLEEKGFIYKGNYSGWYSITDENYLSQKPEEENDNIVWREEECYYFKLSALEDKLKTFYEKNADTVFPKTRYNEVMGFINKGLADFVVSRPKDRLHWGIEVPGDESHVMYVWVDALVNYLSAIDYPNDGYKNYWPAVHILGKDILKFHAIYWPAMLIAADIAPMSKLIVHGWWLNDDAKISKSSGNAIDLDELKEKYQADGIRYFLIKHMSIGEDAQFKEEFIKAAVHGDLANKYGNLFLRLLGLIELGFGSRLPELSALKKVESCKNLEKLLEEFKQMLEGLSENPELANEYVSKFLECISEMNNCFQEHKIWAIQDKHEQAAYLYFFTDVFKKLSILIYPIMPETANEVMQFFGFKEVSMKHYDVPLGSGFFNDKPKFFPKNK